MTRVLCEALERLLLLAELLADSDEVVSSGSGEMKIVLCEMLEKLLLLVLLDEDEDEGGGAVSVLDPKRVVRYVPGELVLDEDELAMGINIVVRILGTRSPWTLAAVLSTASRLAIETCMAGKSLQTAWT